MKRDLRMLAAVGLFVLALVAASPTFSQKSGGILQMSHFDSPASMSMHEEATGAVNRLMGVVNNLVLFDQHVAQNSVGSIVADLATGWSWNEDGTELTLPLRQGVRWHDGRPFTGKDSQMHLGPADRKVARETPP
jgi:peptide/nickel transport system substrate-binding protein